MDGIGLAGIAALTTLALVLVPAIQHRLLILRRDGMLQRVARARGSRLIPLLHYRETYRFFNIPLWDRDEPPDAERALRLIARTPANVPIDLVIHTTYGSLPAAIQLAHAVIRHPARVTAFVPHYALGGGVLVALAADELVMDPSAALSTLEPIVAGAPASSFVALRQWQADAALSDRTLLAIDRAERELAQAKTLVAELLVAGGLSVEIAETAAAALTAGHWTPDYRILIEEARSLGLPVASPLPDDLYAFADLFDLRQLRARVSGTSVIATR